MATRIDYAKLSLMDALDLATLIEVEAVKRYTQFAERLGGGVGDDAASVFQSMVVNENKHGEQLAEQREPTSRSTTSSTSRRPTSARRAGTCRCWVRT